MNLAWLVALILAAGAVLPLQALVNARLGGVMGSALTAAFLSFLVGTVALGLLMVTLAGRQSWPTPGNIAATQPWMWVGGLMGALLVFVAAFATPRTGAALLIALIVTGQMLTSVVLDHFGVLIEEARPLTLWRVLGASLIVAGVVMIQRG